MTEELKNKYPDLNIYMDHSSGKRYTKDSFISGIYRFAGFSASFNFDDDGKPLNPGIFKRSPNGWNIADACNWLHSHAGGSSKHACAKYVRMAIEAGGLSTNGRPNWAWKYIDYLPNIGFKFIDLVDASYNTKSGKYIPEPGDIAVYQKNGNPSVPGHICMWTGAEWASDFKQPRMLVYKGTKYAYIFRFYK